MLRLLLVRHGQTEWNLQRRIMGHGDIPLNQTGVEQSVGLRNDLAGLKIRGLVTSPILRAKQTADILSEVLKVEPVEDSRLQEVSYGEWIGKTFKEVREIPGYVPYFKRLETPVAPGGETLYEVRDRALEFLQGLEAQEGDNTYLAVTHADWIKCLAMDILKVPFEQIWKMRIDNCSLTQIESQEGRRRIICLNQSTHMDRLFDNRSWF